MGILMEVTRAKIKYDGDDCMNLKEISILLGIPLDLLEWQIEKGKLKAHKVKGEYYMNSKEYKKIISEVESNQGKYGLEYYIKN